MESAAAGQNRPPVDSPAQINQARRDFSGAHFESSAEASRAHGQYRLELGHQFQYRFQSRNRHSRFRLVCSRPVHHQRGQWDGRHRDSVQSSDLHAGAHDAERAPSLQHRRQGYVRDHRLAERARERAGCPAATARAAAAPPPPNPAAHTPSALAAAAPPPAGSAAAPPPPPVPPPAPVPPTSKRTTWAASSIYTAGMTATENGVTYNGVTYKANWWTQG